MKASAFHVAWTAEEFLGFFRLSIVQTEEFSWRSLWGKGVYKYSVATNGAGVFAVFVRIYSKHYFLITHIHSIV